VKTIRHFLAFGPKNSTWLPLKPISRMFKTLFYMINESNKFSKLWFKSIQFLSFNRARAEKSISRHHLVGYYYCALIICLNAILGIQMFKVKLNQSEYGWYSTHKIDGLWMAKLEENVKESCRKCGRKM
jgi:hypothetical protein